MENKSYDIEGMSCASCSQAVEKAAAKVAGVKEATVNLATEKLTVTVDESQFSENLLKNAVDAAGYVLVANKKEKTFLIEGMSCASCSQTVEKVTRAVAGVSDASVNLATEKMFVSYDPTMIHPGDIERVVAEAGYKAIEESSTIEESDQNQAKKEQHIKNMWRRFWLSAVFTIPLLYLAMGHMLGLPLPMSLHPEMHPVTFALTQLVLTIPVMLLGTKFFTVGFKSLFKGHPNMDSLVALGTSAAFLYSLYGTVAAIGGNNELVMNLYYESAAVILTLITLGKYFEAVSKGKTSEAIKKLMGLAPKTARVIRDGNEQEIKLDVVMVGDILVVRPGEKWLSMGKSRKA